MRELLGQDFEVDQDGVPRLHRGSRQGRILSPVDPEMRHRRKSQQRRFDGHKLHAAATNSAQRSITAIELGPASEQDGSQAGALIDQQPERRRPERLLGDSAYGSGPVRAELAECQVEVLAPVAEPPRRDDRLLERDFEIDIEAGTVTCPQGQVAEIRTQSSGQRRAGFSKPVCDRCPLRSRWLPSKGRRQILIAPEEELLSAARQALADPPTAEQLRRTRPRIERLLGLLCHRYRTRKARYIGSARARLQAPRAAALVNLNPIGRQLAAAAA